MHLLRYDYIRTVIHIMYYKYIQLHHQYKTHFHPNKQILSRVLYEHSERNSVELSVQFIPSKRILGKILSLKNYLKKYVLFQSE